MRRLILLAGLLVAMLLPAPVAAGTCPALEGGVVDKASYRLGELIDFYGTYHDFADPGTVSITFERTTDGAVREYTANNSPDGSWYLRFTLESSADLGRWVVTAVVDQTGSLDTCRDRVTILPRSGLPNTATVDTPAAPGGGGADIPVVLLALGALALGLGRVYGSRSKARR
jgi:hypothetical protein